MKHTVTVHIDDRAYTVADTCTVAAALMIADRYACRQSVTGMQRGPLCGMGVCHECRVTIDDVAHQLACQTLCRDGMRITTAAAKGIS